MHLNVANKIVEMVSKETNIPLTFDRFSESSDDVLICTGQRNTTYLIVCYGPWQERYIVRGLLKRKRRNARTTWIINGQAGRNTSQVAFWDESHNYYMTADEYAEHICRGSIPYMTADRIRMGGFKPCVRLTTDEIIAAIDRFRIQQNQSMSEKRMIELLNAIEQTPKWPDNSTPTEHIILLDLQLVHHDAGEVHLTGMGELELEDECEDASLQCRNCD